MEQREQSKEHSQREELHQRILCVAAELFRSEGIRSVRVDDIAAKAGVSKRTLYEEFADKEAVLFEVMKRHKQEIFDRLRMQMENSENVLEVMLCFMQLNIETFSRTNPKFIEELKRYPKLLEHFRKDREDNHFRAVEFMKTGVEQGLFRDDINVEIILQVQQAVFDCSMPTLSKAYPLSEVYRTILLLFLRGVCTPRGGELIEEFLQKVKAKEKEEESKRETNGNPLEND